MENLIRRTLLDAMQEYNPPSLVCTEEIFKCDSTLPSAVTNCPICKRSPLFSLSPSRSQTMSGVGLPDATHLSLRDGPDRRVCSPKLWRISGGSTVIW